MASLANDPGGRRRILFHDRDGKRRTIRLGKLSKRDAETIRVRIEHLVAASIAGTAPEGETSRWLADIGDDLHGKLSAVGLAEEREKAAGETLGAFLDSYFAERKATRKPNTLIVWGQTRRCLTDYFGERKPLRDITPGDADAFREHLRSTPAAIGGKPLSENTVRRRCGFAKQFLRAAVRKRLIDANPFDGIEGTTVKSNRSRDYFLTRADADAVLAACPDLEWKLIFSLSRYGGLRCPSEHLALTWGDIDWERGRIRVTSPKTEHHAGREERTIPLFPELRPLLSDAFDAALEGEAFIITRYRSATQNLRTQFQRIIRRAGLTPWPRLFHNLRATRQTELAATYPIHVVCRWIGNSEAVAQEHYLTVTDADFHRAVTEPVQVAQNPAQYTTEFSSNETQRTKPAHEKTPGFPGVSEHCESMQCTFVDRGRIELPTPGFSVLCSTD